MQQHNISSKRARKKSCELKMERRRKRSKKGLKQQYTIGNVTSDKKTEDKNSFHLKSSE
jgi:hypothetical protein